MLLLTTPDYLPKRGGLTTHTLNIEKVLKKLEIEYDVFHWKDYSEIVSFQKEKLNRYDQILNIHSGFHMFMPESKAKIYNFICGSEILFYSPNFIKHFVKQLLKRKCLRRLEQATNNIFISDFTFQKLISKGYKENYSRDIIYHMCVDTSEQIYTQKNWNDDPLTFICVARDVPHKNFAGVIKLCEAISDISKRKVVLHTLTNKVFHSDKIKIHSHVNLDNKERDFLLAKSHINLLLSLDHSQKGFFEGFGQIVQEAGCFGTPSVVLSTGGLPESVHDGMTGWVLQDIQEPTVEQWWKEMTDEVYQRVSKQCHEHTLLSHGLNSWENLFRALLVK